MERRRSTLLKQDSQIVVSNQFQEVYLLQTRLQKMPYKHIAAYLKKTELACRLHYHQLSHGSNRRKRTVSITSSTSHSPVLSTISASRLPSPIEESAVLRSTSPSSYTYSPIPTHNHIHLPAIIPREAHAHLPPPTTTTLPIAILPKPNTIPRRLSSDPLHLDCTTATPPPYSHHTNHPIDHARLQSAYVTHRADFWSKVASEYSSRATSHASPDSLEQAFFAMLSATRSTPAAAASAPRARAQSPPTPCVSPSDCLNEAVFASSAISREEKERKEREQEKTATAATTTTGISVSALLGINASPRSPDERELVRLMEQDRRGSLGA